MTIEGNIPPQNDTQKTEEVTDFQPVHELDSIENLDNVSKWFKEEAEEYTEARSGYMGGYHYEDFINGICEYLVNKFGIKTNDNLDIEYGSKTTGKEFMETISGTVSVLGKEILKYSSDGEGMSMTIDTWNDENLKQILSVLLERKL